MAQADRPNHGIDEIIDAEVVKNAVSSSDLLGTIQIALDSSKDEFLLEEFCNEEDDDDDTLSNGSQTDNTSFSVKEFEIGIDEIVQSEMMGGDLDRIIDENSSLKFEVQQNKLEIGFLKEKVVSLDQLVTQLQTKFDDEIKAIKDSSKPTDCNLSKALKRDIIETKNMIATIQEDKFDKKTKEKNSEKLSLKKLDEISFEIIDLKDLINKNIAEHEKLQQTVNNIKRNNKNHYNSQKENLAQEVSSPSKLQQENTSASASYADVVSLTPKAAETTKPASVRSRLRDDKAPPLDKSHTSSTRNDLSSQSNISSYVIGDSILKDLHPHKLDWTKSTKVRTLSGRTLEGIRAVLMTQDLSSLDSLIIHAGTNNVPRNTGPDIVSLFADIINEIRYRYPNLNIFISTILPREDDKTQLYQDKINYVNENLKPMAKKLNFKLIDNESLKDPELRYDGLHLNFRGTINLARNFKEALMQRRSLVTPSVSLSYSNKSFASSQTRDQYRDFMVTKNQSQMPQPSYNNHRRNQTGEQNHITSQLNTQPIEQYVAPWPFAQEPKNLPYMPFAQPPYPYYHQGMANPFAYQPRQYGMPVPVY